LFELDFSSLCFAYDVLDRNYGSSRAEALQVGIVIKLVLAITAKCQDFKRKALYFSREVLRVSVTKLVFSISTGWCELFHAKLKRDYEMLTYLDFI
jgi:hypothetical protein